MIVKETGSYYEKEINQSLARDEGRVAHLGRPDIGSGVFKGNSLYSDLISKIIIVGLIHLH